VHERFFESQGSNGLLGHRSRAVAPQQLRLGGKGIVFTRTTPLDLSDLQENFTRMYQEETLDEAEEEPEPNACRDDVAEEVNAAERGVRELYTSLFLSIFCNPLRRCCAVDLDHSLFRSTDTVSDGIML
jgi:hypothetical protein